MQSESRPPMKKLNLQRKLTLAHVAVTLVATLLAELVMLGALATLGTGVQIAHILLATVAAAVVGSLLGAWVSRRVVHRMDRALKISRAWLRGNLSLRIADPVTDDLGVLADQLDLMAEHLERDEQDLNELRERNTRLTDQVRALAVVEERNRLARELHDSVKQHLFSLAMTASAIRTRFDALPDIPEELVEMAQEIETSAQIAQRETTRLIEDLRPGTLQERGLSGALNDYTLLFGAREHVLIYLDVQGNDNLLPPSVAEALYRVAQESLHNVTRHAQATRADVHLRCLPMQVTLTVHDNGIGFDTTQPRRGLGLTSMQERIMVVGGRLSIESHPGGGATIRAQVPLPHAFDTSVDPQAEISKLIKDRPSPTIENWAWLGQRLVIPVGQTWPWLPADRIHLRRPLVELSEEALTIKKGIGFLGLRRGYVLRALGQGRQPVPLARVHRSRVGYEWEAESASWALHRIRGLNGRMVLMRNGQPLAAMQYRGRLLDTWNEIIYDGRGYRLSYVKGKPDARTLEDESGNEYLSIEGGRVGQVMLRRALPLPLLVMVTMRIWDEILPTATIVKSGD
ncbi:MAG: sensor histidine kinase [Chloroflexi bacterium]|nr:sensor histidine kinase [Chloroflexota bacterium]